MAVPQANNQTIIPRMLAVLNLQQAEVAIAISAQGVGLVHHTQAGTR
jgi:hypothetical protein